MTETERYKKLKTELEDLGAKAADLWAKINAPKNDDAKEFDELVRAELLGDASAASKRAAIRAPETPHAELLRLGEEHRDIEHRREILRSVLEEVRKKAEPELGVIHTKAFARALKAFATAVRAAYRAEVELATVREQAGQAFIDEIESRLVPLPDLVPLLHRGHDMLPELANALDQLKNQGFDVS